MKSSHKALALALVLALAAPAALGGAHLQADQNKKDDQKNDKYKVKLDLPPYTGPKKRLGVMDLEIKVTATATTNPTPQGGTTTTQSISAPTNTDFGTGLTEMLTTALVDSNRFVVLERKAAADFAAEAALSGGGTATPPPAGTATPPPAGTATPPPAGGSRILSAQALIRGAVTEFSHNSSSTGGNGLLGNIIGGAVSKNEATVVLDIRIYDPATSQILDSVQGTGKVKSSAASLNLNLKEINLGGSSFQESPLGEATRKAIADCVKKICNRMEKLPWEARIAELEADGQTLYMNAGA